MKKLILPAGIALAAVCAAAVTAANSSNLTFDNDLPWPTAPALNMSGPELERTFADPGDRQLSCYYYILSGNLSPEGVAADFRAMKRQGINRAFIGYHGIDNLSHGNVWLHDSVWYESMRTAMRVAREEGIEVGVFNSPGWSQSGGPWVKPEESQRYLAIVDTVVDVDPGAKDIVLSAPANSLGDFAVLAYPAPAGRQVSAPLNAGVNEIELPGNFVLRSAVVKYPTEVVGNIAVEAFAGGEWKRLGVFDISRRNMMPEVGYDPLAPVSVSFEPVETGRIRLIATPNPEAGQGSVTFSENPVVASYADKSLAKLFPDPQPYWKEYKWPLQVSQRDTEYLRSSQVRDITASLRGDRLSLSALPAGRWTVSRLYLAPVNVVNGPTLPGDGQGLEIDRWNRTVLDNHFDAYIGDLERHIPEADRAPWKVIVADSYERGTQNIGDDFIGYFKEHFGYDPLPYLLSYKGTVVDSPERTDRFLWDMRRCVADRLAKDYIAGLRRKAKETGRTLWLEPYGHWGFPGEFLMYGGYSDEVAGEFWSFGNLGDYENRSSTSVSHTYGKGKTSAESFTVGTVEFTLSPRDFKLRGDRFFAEGINNTLLHVYVSQPDSVNLPGVNTWFGNEFNRKNTWWPQLYQFADYLKRSNLLLQQGNYVADVAYYIGEDVPCMVGTAEPAPPTGVQYDFINAEVIETAMRGNDNHTMTLPHGTTYRLLVLPPSDNMRPEVLRAIARIIREGGVVLGRRPLHSPSLAGYPQSERELTALADSLWGPESGAEKCVRKVGKGLLLTGHTISEAMSIAGFKSDFEWRNADGSPAVSHAPVAFGFLDDGKADIRYAHCAAPGRDIYFVANQTAEPKRIVASFRDARGRQPELWDAIDGTRRLLPEYETSESATTVPLSFAPQQSYFIVFEKKTSKKLIGSNFPEGKEWLPFADSWTLRLDSPFGESKTVENASAGSLTDSDDPELKYFSGTMTYRTVVNLPKVPKRKRVRIDLGAVGDMAEVYVNGRLAGGVWTAPYSVDITDGLRKGRNSIEIKVVNTWNNRLIGDAALPAERRRSSYTYRTLAPSSPLQPSGLLSRPRLILMPE